MYAATVKGRDLTFQVSGKLWNRSLLMRDVETGSLWSHILGEGMEGPLKGEKLELLPGEMTTWKDWVARRPDTLVLNLSRTADRFDPAFYRRPEKFVYGLARPGKEAKAWGMGFLGTKPVVHDDYAGEPVVVVFDEKSTRIDVFSRELGGKELRFGEEPDGGKLVEAASGSRFDLQTGAAVDGPLEGKRLDRLVGILSYRAAWENFHPDGTIVER